MIEFLLTPNIALTILFIFLIGIALAHLSMKWRWLKVLSLIIGLLLILAWLPSLALGALSGGSSNIGSGILAIVSLYVLGIPTIIMLGYLSGSIGLWARAKFFPAARGVFAALLSAAPVLFATIFVIVLDEVKSSKLRAELDYGTIFVALGENQFELPYAPYITMNKGGRSQSLRSWRSERGPKFSDNEIHSIRELKVYPVTVPVPVAPGFDNSWSNAHRRAFQESCRQPKNAKTKKCLFSPPDQFVNFQHGSPYIDFYTEIKKIQGSPNGTLLDGLYRDETGARMTDIAPGGAIELRSMLLKCRLISQSSNADGRCGGRIKVDQDIFARFVYKYEAGNPPTLEALSPIRDHIVEYWVYMKETYGVRVDTSER